MATIDSNNLLTPIEGTPAQAPATQKGLSGALSEVSNKAQTEAMNKSPTLDSTSNLNSTAVLENALGAKDIPTDSNAQGCAKAGKVRAWDDKRKELHAKKGDGPQRQGALRGKDLKDAKETVKESKQDTSLQEFVTRRTFISKLRQTTSPEVQASTLKAPQEDKGKARNTLPIIEDNAKVVGDKAKPIGTAEPPLPELKVIIEPINTQAAVPLNPEQAKQERSTRMATDILSGMVNHADDRNIDQLAKDTVAKDGTVIARGVVTDRNLLHGYKYTMDSKTLFQGIVRCLSDPNISQAKKTQLEDFTKKWLACGLYNEDVNSVREEIAQILPDAKIPADIGARTIQVPTARANQAMKVDEFVGRVDSGKAKKEDIALIADEIHLSCAEKTANITVGEVLRYKPPSGQGPPPNTTITRAIAQFNTTTDHFQDFILGAKDLKQAQKRAEFTIRVANNLIEKGNMDSALAIYSSLTVAHMLRLKFGENFSPEVKKMFNKMEEIFDPVGGMKKLIAKQRELEADGKPMVPHTSIFTKQVVAGDEGNPKVLNEGKPEERFNPVRINIGAQIETTFISQTRMIKARLQQGGAEHKTDLSQIFNKPFASDDARYDRSLTLKPRAQIAI